MAAYYNENDPFAAQWLRNLIAGGLIAPGDVDGRSIKEVTADDVRGYTQVHLFAGIAGWSLALRMAGWDDSRPVWTGSCPCQPFSAAGQRGGTADPRHLWPEMHRLLAECRPGVVFGEQVASKDGLAWLDGVCADLESSGYAVGALDLCAAGVGAPHIRQRLYWVAHADGRDPGATRLQRSGQHGQQPGDGGAGGMGDADRPGPQRRNFGRDSTGERLAGAASVDGGLDNSASLGWVGRGPSETGGRPACATTGGPDHARRTGPADGAWGSPDRLFCRDGRWRPVEPGASPLAHGVPGRVGRLRAYGNAVCAPLAAEFVAAAMDCMP